MLTADYGGTGGKPIESGLVVEEPDIEIGAGVSSKGKHANSMLVEGAHCTLAISRRMATDRGGQQGPRSTRDTTANSTPQGSRYRQPERNDRDVSNIGVPPAVPGFGFQFSTMPNGMPMFPPGFVIPGTTAAQPPPPGAS
jgi:protein NRD1